MWARPGASRAAAFMTRPRPASSTGNSPRCACWSSTSTATPGGLQAAGYVSRLIPLFAAPGLDGRASGRQMEGSVKGDGAVGEIAPRLHALLDNR